MPTTRIALDVMGGDNAPTEVIKGALRACAPEHEGQLSAKRVLLVGDEDVIRRELKVEPGDEYNTVRIAKSQAILKNTGYYSTVDFTPTDSEVSGFKDVNITVTEKSTGVINFGAGFSSIDNLVGFLDITQTNFDLWNWGRWTGAGQKFRASIKAGTERREAQ